MFDFQRLATDAAATRSSGHNRGMPGAVLVLSDALPAALSALRDADGGVTVTAPEHDGSGRFWFFICGDVAGAPVSIPHTAFLGRHAAASARSTMNGYRRCIVALLAQRGYRVAPGTVERGRWS